MLLTQIDFTTFIRGPVSPGVHYKSLHGSLPLNMLIKLSEFVAQADTFKLFSNDKLPNILKRINESPRISSKEELENRIYDFFQEIVNSSNVDSLYYNEAIRLLGLFKKFFDETSDPTVVDGNFSLRDPIDDLVDSYTESLREFVSGLDVPVIQEHLEYILL